MAGLVPGMTLNLLHANLRRFPAGCQIVAARSGIEVAVDAEAEFPILDVGDSCRAANTKYCCWE
jgi:hypothetical protein